VEIVSASPASNIAYSSSGPVVSRRAPNVSKVDTSTTAPSSLSRSACAKASRSSKLEWLECPAIRRTSVLAIPATCVIDAAALCTSTGTPATRASSAASVSPASAMSNAGRMIPETISRVSSTDSFPASPAASNASSTASRSNADAEMCLPSTATFSALDCRGVIVTPVRRATSAGMYR
jgi:hypothetical protein